MTYWFKLLLNNNDKQQRHFKQNGESVLNSEQFPIISKCLFVKVHRMSVE